MCDTQKAAVNICQLTTVRSVWEREFSFRFFIDTIFYSLFLSANFFFSVVRLSCCQVMTKGKAKKRLAFRFSHEQKGENWIEQSQFIGLKNFNLGVGTCVDFVMEGKKVLEALHAMKIKLNPFGKLGLELQIKS